MGSSPRADRCPRPTAGWARAKSVTKLQAVVRGKNMPPADPGQSVDLRPEDAQEENRFPARRNRCWKPRSAATVHNKHRSHRGRRRPSQRARPAWPCRLLPRHSRHKWPSHANGRRENSPQRRFHPVRMHTAMAHNVVSHNGLTHNEREQNGQPRRYLPGRETRDGQDSDRPVGEATAVAARRRRLPASTLTKLASTRP